MTIRTIAWHAGRVQMIDQRLLPWTFTVNEYSDYREGITAIKEMVIRGAPAIGAAGAFALALAAQSSPAADLPTLRADLEVPAIEISAARPTAINLRWAVDAMMRHVRTGDHPTADALRTALVAEACRIADDDVAINRQMGAHGAALVQRGWTVLHHCNTGSLATVDYGTALGVIRTAHEDGKEIRAVLTETRPRMQGARLSAWELNEYGVPFVIIPDSAAASTMGRGEINAVFVGADRVALNGDTANKIGTYMLAILAKEHGIPFYVVAPTSTIDLATPDGDAIPIEERGGDEVRQPYGNPLIPDHFPVRNPAFDVTPARYITGIVTEYGVARPPYNLAALPRTP